MPALPRHGTTRRYKAGCHCARCTAKNTADKARERAAKLVAQGRVPTVPTRVPTARKVPTVQFENEPEVPTAGAILTATRNALAAYGDDPVLVLRREIAYGIARAMDDPKNGITSTLFAMFRTALTDLLGERAPKDGEADAIRNIMESLGGSRRNRNPPPVPDPA